jgi:anti-sigma B factor antagonist
MLEHGPAIVQVTGRLDLYSSLGLRESLFSILDSGAPPVLVDLTDVDFIDSTGLGVIAVLARHPKVDPAEIAIICPDGRVRRTLTLVGIDQSISVYATLDEAVEQEAAA